MKFLSLVKESRVDDFKANYSRKFSQEQLSKLIDNVPHKYLDWVGKNFDSINFNSNFQDLVTKLRFFDKISSNLPITDINSYKNLEQLAKALEEYTKRPKRDYKETEGGKVVFDDGRYFVVNPQTHNASCHYGKGTKWCTTADSDYQFKRYNEDGKLFYILDRTLDTSDPFYKVALLNKFDGEKSFWKANNESTNILSAQIGVEKFDEIISRITEYMNSEYAEQIKFYNDKEAAKKEKERQRALELARILRMRREEADDRRMENEWALGPDCPEKGMKAHALLDWLVDQGDVDAKTNEDKIEIDRLKVEIERLQRQYDESENIETDLLDEISDLEEELQELENKIDVYNIIPTGKYYDCTEFEVIDAGLSDRTYAVGDEDEMDSSARERVESLLDDIGYDGFNQSFVRGFIDEDAVVDMAENYYSDDVEQNPDVFLDESDRELSLKQEEKIRILEFRIEKTKEEIENLESLRDYDLEDTDEIDSKIEELVDTITEYEDEIEEIKSEPDGEFPQELIDEKIRELVDDVRYDPESWLNQMGYDYNDYINKDEFIDGVISEDGYGHTLNGYDGNADEVKVLDTTYWVMRID